MNTLVEFGKILIPASVVLYAVYLLIRTFLAKELNMKRLELSSKNSDIILPRKLQAYERMVLFLERIAPQNLLLRINNPSYKAADLYKVILHEIQDEYNHNIAQQIYISERVWTLIKNGKDELIAEIHETATTMPEGATGLDLSEKIFQTLIAKNIEPLAYPLSELKKEIQEFF